jgi:hypothetical protein
MIFTQTPVTWTMSNSPDSYRTDLGGRVELYVASPVWFDFVRAYAEGGPQLSHSIQGMTGARTLFGGGGELGCEFFVGRTLVPKVEIGGTAALDDSSTGERALVEGLLDRVPLTGLSEARSTSSAR